MNGTYKRVLLKLSGEQLAGKADSGIDVEVGAWLAAEIKKVIQAGIQVIIVVGGGNFARGAQLSKNNGVKRVTADQIGMLATIMNALALTDIFEAQSLAAIRLSNVFSQQFIEPFTHQAAEKHLAKGRVVIVAGGLAQPYLTTDTTAVTLALGLSCQVVLKATKVDGVYDKDPVQFADAKRFDKISFQEAVANDAIKVMDKSAMGMAMEHQLPIVVFDAMKENNILRVAQGEMVGTIIGSVVR